MTEREVYRALYVLGTREENRALADRKVGRGLQAVLPGPGEDGLEEDPVGFEHIRIRKTLDLGEIFKGRINTSRE